MSATQSAVGPLQCDGCTLGADAEHLRRRIARLEWASRFRPIRISTLLLVPAPPAELEDYFYFPDGMPANAAPRALAEDLFEVCGIPTGGASREPALRAFQHRGFFLSECIECPLEESSPDFDTVLARLIPTLVRRLRVSYRPKSVLLLSGRLAPVAQAVPAAGAGTSLLLWQGAPIALPDPFDSSARAAFRSQLAALFPALARSGS